MKYDVLIFDWDGTLLNSADHIAQCMHDAFAEVGQEPPTLEAAKDIIGLGMVEAITTLRPGLDAGLVERIRERYVHHFFGKPAMREDLFEGVLETLEHVSGLGFKLAIATGKSRRGMDLVLDQLDMRDHFHAVRCADETRSKPHPQMLMEILRELDVPVERALMIGDSEYDMLMAKAIGMDRLAVSYGVHGRERLMVHEPVHCIDSMVQLRTWL